MSSVDSLLALVGGLVVLVAGAEALVRGATALAVRLGISPLVVGLTVVAIGTSSPELVVSVEAALAGQGGVALGNIVGSNIANLGLIVGVGALIKPLDVEQALVRRDVPIMIATMVLMVVFLLDGAFERWEGALLLAGAVVYTAHGIRASRRATHAAQAAAEFEVAVVTMSRRAAFRDVLLVVGGIATLVVGANLLLGGAVALAEAFGVSEAVIGLTLVALGTSLPELATTVVAGLRGEGGVALGNAVGSNIFNTFGVLGVTAVAVPFAAPGVGALSLGVMLALGVLTLGLAIGGCIRRWEGGILLAAYAGYIGWLAFGAGA